MKLKNITPRQLRCIGGACPAIYETDRGSFVLIGRRLDSANVDRLLLGKVAANEEVIEVPRDVLSKILCKKRC